MPPIYNALAAGKGGVPNQPVTQAAQKPGTSKPPAPAAMPSPGFNSKPGPQATGASPALVGDKQKIQRPAAPQIASSATAPRAAASSSGMETAMGAMADKLHPVKRR